MTARNTTDLGPCCICEKTGKDVRNIIYIDRKGPVPDKGWGCVQCGLPFDGATAVICDNCFESKAAPRYVCTGYPAIDGQTPIEELSDELFTHDLTKHPEFTELN